MCKCKLQITLPNYLNIISYDYQKKISNQDIHILKKNIKSAIYFTTGPFLWQLRLQKYN